ncbi:hypothetical protein PIECOFPK_02425 [Mycovorax composti]|jgi:hypothetical protein|uniref:DUF4293 family protein n=2 Tax=Chitinophagaceae TaxID=563835 RepID=A0ABZ2EME6_9BACT
MIQRKQTLWLLLSSICSGLTFKFPFYVGTVAPGTQGVEGPELTATDNIYLILLTVAVLGLAVVSIFLFKNRKKQVLLCYLGLLGALGLPVVYYNYSQYFQQGAFALTSLLTVLIIIGFIFAIQGIRRDEKLIRDLNRLR